MTEDFIHENQQLVTKLIQLQKPKSILKFWTLDGRLFAKPSEHSGKVMITSMTSIDEMLSVLSDAYLISLYCCCYIQ